MRYGQIDFFARYNHACDCAGIDCGCRHFSAVAFVTPLEETSNPLIVDSTENRNFMAVKLPHIKADSQITTHQSLQVFFKRNVPCHLCERCCFKMYVCGAI